MRIQKQLQEVKMVKIFQAAIMTFIMFGVLMTIGCGGGGGDDKSASEKAATPVFSPSAGNFDSNQNITISTTTAGAVIYYTTDNTTPSTSSNKYSTAISVAGDGTSITIKAIAVKSGMDNSNVASGTFTIDYDQVSSPQISPTPVKFNSPQTVTISCTTSGATIRYTTDNSNPSETSGIEITGGSGSFTLSSTTTVKAIAYKTGMSASSITAVDYSFQQWTWVSGSSSTDQATTSDTPGARYGSCSWTDPDGNLWLFGGKGYYTSGTYGDLNDLWRYNPSSGVWTFISGDDSVNQSGVYGIQNTADELNIPGAREYSISWIDSSGNLWLFGGYGYDASGHLGYLNDLWKFDGTNWTWISGYNARNQSGVYGTLGTADGSNIPGAREYSMSWIDSSNNLWLFGGYGYDINGDLDDLNDLWSYNLNTGSWTWVDGDDEYGQAGAYGEIGVPSSSAYPGAREAGESWVDSSGFFWLSGGYGYDKDEELGDLNDLWKYDPSTKEWTWVSGSDTIDNIGVYGTLGTPDVSNTPGAREYSVSWIDSSDNLWLFGGYGFGYSDAEYGELNDLWKFDGTNWTWISGENTADQPGVYGTLGTPDVSNTAGARDSGVSWIDSSGSLWLFGGYGLDADGDEGELNDLWKFEP